MSEYWRNGSGYYDPTAKQAIDNHYNPDNNVRDGIQEVKQLLRGRNLKVLNRMIIKDKKSGKVYK